MKSFIGTKVINAKPMTRGEYNAFRGWALPSDEKADDEGYLVEYTDGSGGNVASFDGYVSWSPKDVFEKAYRQTSGLSFGLAIEALKKGLRVARAGWNGKGMWLCLSPGRESFSAVDFWAPANRDYALEQGGSAKVLPSISMKTAAGEIQMGWTASQADMLADDWTVVA
jgi:hypothetical protein